MTVNEAVRALRKHAGKTQQVFATELGISISSLNNYERERIPEPKQLFLFGGAAHRAGRSDLAFVFNKTALEALGAWRGGWYEYVLGEALEACLGDSQYHDIASVVVSALAPIVGSKQQAFPEEHWSSFENESVKRGYAVKSRGKVIWQHRKGGRKQQ